MLKIAYCADAEAFTPLSFISSSFTFSDDIIGVSMESLAVVADADDPPLCSETPSS